MSFILDALRKVDRQTREAEEVAPPVAVAEKLRKERRSRRGQFAAMAAIGALSALATTLLLRRGPAPVVPPVAEVAEAPVDIPPVEPESAEPETPEPGTAEAPPVVEPGPRESLREPPPPPVEEAPVEDTSVEVTAAAAELQPAPELDAPASEPEASEIPQLVLQGTSVLAGKSVAVVSDRRVFVGDYIEGALVVRIEERLVELEFGGRRFTLTF
jgi:hypothetical protein